MLVTCHFVFYSYFEHQPPHSFPTRRSSDLHCSTGLWLGSGYADHAAPEPRADAASRRKLDQDRKSTRLNSSHLVISYAVFCLKKKKLVNERLMQVTGYNADLSFVVI